MQVCKSVKLRMRDRRNGTKSLFLDFWPGYRDPETMELIRRRSLGLYIYANPINAQQKQYNEIILSKAEAIRCRVFIDVINEKYDFFNQDRLKEDFLIYFKEMVNRNFAKCDAAYKQFEKFCKGKCTFEMLDVVYCNKYKEYLLDTKVSSRGRNIVNKPLSRNTASAYWNIFKQVLTKAYRERRFTDDIASLLDNIPCTPPVKQSLSLEEVRRLYNTECSEPVVRKAALFSCLSGLRISDILNLKWNNVCSYADGGHYLDFECVKTKRQTKVPIGEDAYALIMPKTTDEYVFEGFSRSMTYGVMQQWLKASGITKHITFHCFRHTYASLQLEMGTDIYTVQHLLNHKNVSTTQIYASHADPKTREAANRITLTNVKEGLQTTESENNQTETNRKEDINRLYRYCPCLRDRTANQISGYSGRNNLDYLYLCDMAKKSNTSLAYETLLNIILPDGILEIFEVSNVREEHTGIIEETGLELRIIHIHLDERDLRVKEWHDLRPNGFTEEHCINDFPIRDRKVVLHVRRRRWLDDEGKNVILPHEGLTAPGTSYSKEFADVLKKIFGCLPDTGPLSGAVL